MSTDPQLDDLVHAKIKSHCARGNGLANAAKFMGAMLDDDIRYASNASGCFIKGTLVHTQDGLRPIDEIKVGHYVLSSPEDGTGSAAYKRVNNVFVHENETIRHISIFGPTPECQFVVGATGNHPFWVEGLGWTRADKLDKNDILRRGDASLAKIDRSFPVYRTSRDGVGWVQMFDRLEESYGSVFNYAKCESVELEQDEYLSDEVCNSDDPFLRVRVYNLGVEDFHTYYVGSEGYWVRS
ncbi:MAG: polymorphic toxin-type HINT domain-containing protein [Pseudomonadota bacterium]